MTPLETNLRAFFEEYASTFHQDVEGFCERYAFPSETVRLDGTVQRFQTKDEAAHFFGLAKKKYEDEGCARWGIRCFVAEERGPGSAVATIDWDMKTIDGMPIRGWRQTYEVIGGPTHWKVQRSTLHSGSEVAYRARDVLPELITTARAILRPFRSSDIDDVLAYGSDPAWNRYLFEVPEAYGRAEAQKFLADRPATEHETHPRWAIEFQQRVVGGINVRFAAEHRIGELGYGVARPFWGQGLAVEVARAVIGASFESYPQLVRIRARTDARNVQSLRVMEKLGMQREALLRSDRLFRGELADEVVCGLLRGEWKP